MSFASYSIGSSQTPLIPKSEGEQKLAELFYIQIRTDNLDEFIETLNNYPQYINILYYHPVYKDYFSPLQLAVVLGRDRFIDELLKRDVDPSLPTLSKHNTILHISPMPRITKKFVNLGLNREALNYQNMTPLLVQVFKKRLNREAILALLESGVDLEAKN